MSGKTQNALALARLEKGYTQERLASESSTSVKTIQLWEKIGTMSASVRKLAPVASALGVDISDILC